jgi:major membrane immunogen (membrane-anchored lipoprotein)
MEVTVERGKLGFNTYHIRDKDGRQIACHGAEVVELIRKLQRIMSQEELLRQTKDSRANEDLH